MREMLTQVIASGTGKAAAIEGYDGAGKTGTARKPQPGGGYLDAEGRYHYISTFAGFLPAGDPKLSIIVVIDEPTTSPYASRVAAPAFAEIGRHALRLLAVPPAAGEAPLAISADKVRAAPAEVPTTAPAAPPEVPTTAPAAPPEVPTTAPAAPPSTTVPAEPPPTAAIAPLATGTPAGTEPPLGD
jgi:membrane peptidoglycan carboxypeptidase